MLPAKCLLLLVLSSSGANCYNILGLFPHRGISHFYTFQPILKALAGRGHNLTVVSYFSQKDKIPGYNDISLQDDSPEDGPPDDLTEFKMKGTRSERWIKIFQRLSHFGNLQCEKDLFAPQLVPLINGDDKFDLIIAEFFNTECFLAFVHKYKAPLIGLSSCAIMPWNNERFGNPDNPSYIPEMLLYHSDKMTFLERLENTVIGVLHRLVYDKIVMARQDQISRQLFGPDMPPLDQIAKNSSLFLVNTHFSLNRPRPSVPAVIEIGGVHIGPKRQLPSNIEKWINESTHGVIYFSLGSMIKGHTFPEEKRQEFLKAFARLPQRILWKWENDTMPGKPNNVMIQKWMPQFDILCHPNVKAFISHGGLLGTTEAVHCGVPVIVMPQFGDQFTNAKALEASGGGVILHLNAATEEKVYSALQTVLSPSFKKQAEELSERFRDRPLPPLETAIYWIEYVARHRGAHHMRTAAVNMPLYQYLLLDVIAFLLFVFLITSAAIFYVVRYLFRLVFVKQTKEKLKKT